MACLSLAAIEHWLIWLVAVGAVVAVIWLLVNFIVPRVIGPLGEVGALVVQVLRIIFWAVVLIFVIILVFQLLSCLVPLRW